MHYSSSNPAHRLATVVALISLLAVHAGCSSMVAQNTPVAPAAPATAPTQPTPWAAGGAPQVALGTRIEALRLNTAFYAAPAASFIVAPDETVVRVTLGSATAEQAQQQLDAARAQAPAAFLLVTLTGKITVTAAPLSLPARTCVFFQPGALITAAPRAAAAALVRIQDAELVSLAPVANPAGITLGGLDGAGFAGVGIQVVNSGKVHLDGLVIRQCGGGGLVVTGRGAERYADPVSLTRSTISECAGGGLTVKDSAQFIALDNRILRNAGDGLNVDSASVLLANNISAGNRTGIILSGKCGTLSRNQIIANATGLRLAEGSDSVLVSENAIQDNRVGAEIMGTNATVESNRFANAQQVVTGGKGNLLQSNPGLSVDAVTTAGADYFRPPTFADAHRDEVIWKANGQPAMGRFDLTIASGPAPLTDAELTQRLLAARTANPGKVLVARLVGQFKVTTKDGLVLPDHTCVLLDGTLTNDQAEPCDQLVNLAGKGCVSLSGGRVISRSKVTSGLSGAQSSNTLLIDGVSVDLGTDSRVSGALDRKAVNGVSSKKHAGSFIVRGCEIRDPGSRGVWIHVTNRVHVISNRLFGGGMTIDFDAFGNNSTALYNSVTNNTYHSGIFLEEGVKRNLLFANHLFANEKSAIGVYNHGVTQPTERNLVACNLLEDNQGADLSFGGFSKEKPAHDNYAFNNRLVRNRNAAAAIILKGNSRGNYIAQTVFVGSPKQLVNYATKPAGETYTNNAGFTAPAQ